MVAESCPQGHPAGDLWSRDLGQAVRGRPGLFPSWCAEALNVWLDALETFPSTIQNLGSEVPRKLLFGSDAEPVENVFPSLTFAG